MNIFKNKFFLLGNLAFLLLVIPVALFFIKNQTSTRSSAAPTTTLSFIDPSLTPDQCDNTRKSRLVLNPGQNIVSTVQLYLKWDKTKFDIDFAPNQTAFPQTLKGPEQTTDGMKITLNIGADVTKAINTTTDVGTITIKPLAPTNGTVIKLDIDPNGTKVYSLSQQDGATENVYNSAGSSPLQISILAKSCNGGGDGSPTPPTGSPTAVPSGAASPTSSVPSPTSVIATPTIAAANSSPTCNAFATSVASGSAPLAVNFTASGKDTDGTLMKATFNFGDGTQQDIASGLGAASGSAQISHTYLNGGTFKATAVFTDNRGAISGLTCTQDINVAGAFATIAPTTAPTATIGPIATEVPTSTPTIAPSGSIVSTVGIVGGILLVIVAGVFLLAL